jgi:hypothetical protein
LPVSTPTSNASPLELCNLFEGMVFFVKETMGWKLMGEGRGHTKKRERQRTRPLVGVGWG